MSLIVTLDYYTMYLAQVKYLYILYIKREIGLLLSGAIERD